MNENPQYGRGENGQGFLMGGGAHILQKEHNNDCGGNVTMNRLQENW
jgi:hypothetical protein